MGVKSTIRLTRDQAEARLADAIRREQADGLEMFIKRLSDREIEDLLEAKNDAYYRREYGSDSGFDNYLIGFGSED